MQVTVNFLRQLTYNLNKTEDINFKGAYKDK